MHASRERSRNRADRPAVYEVLEATNITDKAAFDKAIGQLAATLRSNGAVLADADSTNGIGSGAPSGHTSVMIFDSFQSSEDWQQSPAFQDLSKAIQKVATVTLMRVGGTRPAAAPEPAGASSPAAVGGDPDLSKNPAQQSARAPKMIKIPDVCRGC